MEQLLSFYTKIFDCASYCRSYIIMYVVYTFRRSFTVYVNNKWKLKIVFIADYCLLISQSAPKKLVKSNK